MLTARTDPLLIDSLPGPDRTVRAVARPQPLLAPADPTARLGVSAAPPRAGAALTAAIVLHAALLAVVLSVGLRSPTEPLPLEAVPLVFEPPAPQAAAEAPPAPMAPAVATPTAAPTPPLLTPDAPPPDLPAPDLPDPTLPTPEASTPVLPAVPLLAPPPLALPVIPPPPSGPSLAAVAPLPVPPAAPPEPEVPHHTATRPTPRPAARHHTESHVEPRAENRPAAVPPAAEASPAAAVPAAPPGPVLPPRPVAGLAGNRRPVYPTQARDRGEQGTVLVLVQVTAQGAAESVSIARSSGHPALDEAAMAAIRSWRFSPATRGGVPVAAEAQVPVAFHLDD